MTSRSQGATQGVAAAQAGISERSARRVEQGRERRKAYLIAFLDDATRVIPYAAFALSENTAAFLPVFKQALTRRGLPERLYVDNGSNFRSHHLALVCAKLGVALIHARPYQPYAQWPVMPCAGAGAPLQAPAIPLQRVVRSA